MVGLIFVLNSQDCARWELGMGRSRPAEAHIAHTLLHVVALARPRQRHAVLRAATAHDAAAAAAVVLAPENAKVGVAALAARHPGSARPLGSAS